MKPPSIHPDALSLLESVDYLALGEGDHIAGMNTFASMCLTTAAVSGPRPGYVTKSGGIFTVGLNWLTSGALSADLLQGRVLAPVAGFQNNLLAGVRPHARIRELPPKERRPYQAQDEVSEAVRTEYLETNMRTEGKDVRHLVESFLSTPAGGASDRFLKNPGFYFNGSDPGLLGKQLACAHLNHPFVYLPVPTLQHCALLQPVAQGIIDGCTLPGSQPVHIRGIVAASTPPRVLHNFLRGTPDNVQWPFEMLWLTDARDDSPVEHSEGSSTPPATAIPLPVLTGIQLRYEAALIALLERRLQRGSELRFSSPCELSTHQRELSQHYRGLEPQMPGIGGLVRTLFPTLLFGLHRMTEIKANAPDYKLPVAGLVALARHLADRMAYTAWRTSASEERDRLYRTADTVILKLSDGPLTAREICRKHHSLSMADCIAGLGLLSQSGRVIEIDGRWHSTKAAGSTEPQPLVIDVN